MIETSSPSRPTPCHPCTSTQTNSTAPTPTNIQINDTHLHSALRHNTKSLNSLNYDANSRNDPTPPHSTLSHAPCPPNSSSLRQAPTIQTRHSASTHSLAPNPPAHAQTPPNPNNTIREPNNTPHNPDSAPQNCPTASSLHACDREPATTPLGKTHNAPETRHPNDDEPPS